MNRRIFFISSSTRSEVCAANSSSGDNKTAMPIYFSARTERTENRASGTMDSHAIYISWETGTEINISYFELQRSENGKDFYSVETIKPQSDGKSRTRYVMMDPKQLFISNRLNYRLKLVSVNEKASFTDAITLNLKTVATALVYDLSYAGNRQYN